MLEGGSLRCILRSGLFLSLHIMLACATGVILVIPLMNLLRIDQYRLLACVVQKFHIL